MLQEYSVGYIHGTDTNAWSGLSDMPKALDLIRSNFNGALIDNAGLTPDFAEAMVGDGRADMVAFGRRYVANPDLVQRIAQNGPYNDPDPFTFYDGAERWYTDYPALA